MQATIDVGGTPTSVAVGEGAAWVLNADDQTITRVDERTRAARTFGSGGVPTDLAVGAGALWVGNGTRTRAQFIGPVATSIVRVDPSTTAVRAAVSLPKARGFTSNLQQDHIAVTPDAVWAVNPDATVSRVDPRADAVSTVVRRLSAGAVAAGDEGVWALGLDSSLARIDPATASVDKRIRVAANTLSAIAVGAGAVWAAAPYDGTVWRVDPGPRLIQRTIDVGAGVTDVAYGRGSVWALNSLRGTVSRIDPETNRVAATVRLGNTPRQIAVGSAGVWVTVAGAAGAPLAAAADAPRGGPALPAATCGRVFYGGSGVPDRLIVSDMPLRGGGALPTPQMSEAIAYVLRQRGFRAGRLRIGYQSCDDSTAQAGIFDEAKCAANAKLYAHTTRGDRRDRPVQLGLRVRPDPDRQPRRPGDDLAHQLRHRPDARDAPRARRARRVPVPDRRAQLRPHLPARGRARGGRGPVRTRSSGRTAWPCSATVDTARGSPPTSRAPPAGSGSMCCRRADGTRRPAATTGSRTRWRGPTPMLSTWPDCSTRTAGA